MTEDQKEKMRRLRDDFPAYAEKCLKIRLKAETSEGVKISSFVLNKAQRYLHAKLEAQLAAKGRVRALILKGRQQGCSTYIGGRFFHKTSMRRGLKTFILTHRDDATDNLFTMVKRFQKHLPEPLSPSIGYSNRKELIFDKLESAYGLGTAGSGSVGRSDTVDLFHGSEAAFWKNHEEIKSGVLQAAEAAKEIVFESTANGFDPFFHAMWVEAEKGRGKYEAIFIPWYWQDEYSSPVPEDFKLADEEATYQEAYGTTLAQMAWRRDKIAEIGEKLFKQEYPATAKEAFQTSGNDALIPILLLESAVGRNVSYQSAPKIMGVDVGMSMGGDPCAIVVRQGGNIIHVEEWNDDDTIRIAGKVKAMAGECQPQAIYVDSIGWGAGVAHHLMGWGLPCVGVNVGESAAESDRFNRRRDELWWKAREFFADKQCSIKDTLETRHKLIAELSTPTYSYMPTGKIKVESKDDLKKRDVASPNLADAFVLTMAHNDHLQDDGYAYQVSWNSYETASRVL